MKREILFRGKRTDNGEWVEGTYHYIENQAYHYILSREKLLYRDNGSFLGLHAQEVSHVQESSVGQFIGITDRNGKKIFEDMNIVDCITKQRYQVKIGPCKRYGFSGVYGETDDGIQIPINGNYGGTKNSEIEIITDNPELLNTKP